MAAGILSMAGLDWSMLNFSTPQAGGKGPSGADSRGRHASGLLSLLAGSTGNGFLGSGEWLARKHGAHRRRQSDPATFDRQARSHNDILRATRYLGGVIWKRRSACNARSRIGVRLRCLKPFGKHIAP